MIIDFHTHILPDKIAARTIEHLSKSGGIPAFSDGTVSGLYSEMERGGVDISVALPVLTSPAQFESVNRYAEAINRESKSIISFAGIHPRCENISEKMKEIHARGFLGVKIHPDYQEAFIDDPGYIEILESAKREGLIVVAHSGVDGAYRGLPVRCTPERAKRVLRSVRPEKFVLAHLGANEMFAEVFDALAGEAVYFDTAYILSYISDEDFHKILEKHGADKILFATDSPWTDVRASVERIRTLGLDRETEEKIFFKNAKSLLGI